MESNLNSCNRSSIKQNVDGQIICLIKNQDYKNI